MYTRHRFTVASLRHLQAWAIAARAPVGSFGCDDFCGGPEGSVCLGVTVDHGGLQVVAHLVLVDFNTTGK
jgi:hypothetical protein